MCTPLQNWDFEWLALNQWLKKLKEFLSELKKFKVQTILALDYKKRNNRKIFYSGAGLITRDLDIEEAFKIHSSKDIDKNKKLC